MPTQIQTPGHLFGPPVPHIAFWYGQQYLGETRLPFNSIDPVATAKKHLDHLDQALFPGPQGMVRSYQRLWSTPQIYYR